jgi:hypothetical protein
MAVKRRKDQGAGRENELPFMPGELARRRREVPTGETRNKDYGKGRQSGVTADQSDREKAQEAELEMNERNH